MSRNPKVRGASATPCPGSASEANPAPALPPPPPATASVKHRGSSARQGMQTPINNVAVTKAVIALMCASGNSYLTFRASATTLWSPSSIVHIQNASAKVGWISTDTSVSYFVQEYTLTSAQKGLHSKVSFFLFFLLSLFKKISFNFPNKCTIWKQKHNIKFLNRLAF